MTKDDANNGSDFSEAEELVELEELDSVEELLQSKSLKNTDYAEKLNLEKLRDLLKPYIDQINFDFAHSSIASAIFDTRLNIRWENKQFIQIFGKGHSLKNQYLSNIFQNFHKNNDTDAVSRLYSALKDPENGYSTKLRVEYYHRDHPTVYADLLLLPIRAHKSGKPIAYLGLFSDITSENKKVLHQTFLSLLEASKLKDNDTGHHIERVNKYCHLLSKALYNQERYPEVDIEFIENIGFLAAMHDVGKIGTPDDILNKAGPLEDKEWEIMKEHTINGGFILSTYPHPIAKQIALFHHEKWNGSGYPYGLEKNMIPLPARIIAIADVYDALRMKRSYKKAFSHEKASEILTAGSGKHFDPHLITYFEKLQSDFNHIYNSLTD